EAAAARGLDDHDVVAAELDGAFAAKQFALPAALEPDRTGLTVFSAVKSPRRNPRALDHRRESGLLGQHSVDPSQAVAAATTAGAAGPGAQLVPFDAQRV